MRRWLLLVGLAGALGCAAGPRPATTEPGRDAAVFTAGQIMVMLAPTPVALADRTAQELAGEYRLRYAYAWTMASLGQRCVVYDAPPGQSPGEVARHLESDPRVKAAAEIHAYRTLASGPDPYASLQKSAQLLHLDAAHQVATGRGVRVAVIDTGVDLDHPDLRGRIAKASSFVDRGETTFTSDVHGTAVAGVLAADQGNDVGIYGAAPEAELWALKACWPDAPGSRLALCNSYTLAKALDFAIAEGAQAINLSLAGPQDSILALLLRGALERGIVVVAADGPSAGESFPASFAGVIPVADVDLAGKLRDDPAPVNGDRLAAPGSDVLTTVPRGSYDFFSGSSFAAAEVSGVVALLLELDPGLRPEAVRALLERTAHGNEGAPPVVDACAAVAALRPATRCR